MKRPTLTAIALTAILTSTTMAQFNFKNIPTKLSAYYLSSFQPIERIKSKLKENGFQILATDKILEGKSVITITNNELKSTSSYMSTLHILVNSQENEVRVQNPSYLASAYLKGYKYGDFKVTLNGLEKVLNRMLPVLQQKEIAKLPQYHFMFGMPYLEDTIRVSHEANLPRSISYILELPNGATLVGHKLSVEINSFLNKIGESKNSQLLPYESMIKDGEATILDPKYYLALSLPNLSMGEFMKIATVPYSIEKEIQNAYR